MSKAYKYSQLVIRDQAVHFRIQIVAVNEKLPGAATLCSYHNMQLIVVTGVTDQWFFKVVFEDPLGSLRGFQGVVSRMSNSLISL